MSTDIVFHTLAALVYIALATYLWQPLQAGQVLAHRGRTARIALLMGIVLQGAALYASVLPNQQLHLSWVLALSVAIWLGLIVFWLESIIVAIDGLQLLLLPFAAFICILAALFPASYLIAHNSQPALRSHLLVALAAYGLITIAALQSMLMAATDHYLHNPKESARQSGPLHLAWSRMLFAQPSLMAQEQLLFRIIWVAFIALTLAVLSGGLISLATTGKILPFDHKTIFTLLSWVTFGVLLLGRHIRGWRGRIALRYTLLGFAFVVLSYSGSRFVIEFILQRHR
jgi:ABC-type uncharacterized transport system permease subunit